MGSLRQVVLFLLFLFTIATACAETKLPDSGDKSGWHQLGDQLAECSAVYNTAAGLKEGPAEGNSSYRELANNALIAGMYSTERAALGDNYLESIYSKKFTFWHAALKNKARVGTLFAKADQCLREVLPVQNQIVTLLREQPTRK